MANLPELVPAEVAFVRGNYAFQHTAPAGEAFVKGAIVTLNDQGRLVNANATTAAATGREVGIANRAANQAGVSVTYWTEAIYDLGDALDGLDIGAPVYLSDTAGTMSDTPGTTTVLLGHVIVSHSTVTGRKLLRYTPQIAA